MPVNLARVLDEVGNRLPPLRGEGGWPVLDPAALHGLAGQIVRAIEPHTEADAAGLLVSTLVEFGAQVGPRPHAMADSAEHPARLFAVLVGETAKGRKGSATKNAERISTAADPEFARKRRLNGFGSGEAVVDAVRGGEGTQDPRLLVNESEFARILNVAGRDGSTLSSIIRQAWDGGRLAVRSRAGTTVAENSHVCVLGQITSDELRARLTQTDTASGFANRFLFASVRRAQLLPSGGNLDQSEVIALAHKFASAAAEAGKVGILRRTPAAEALWGELYLEMAEDEPGGLLGAIIARDCAQMLRLSVAYCLLDRARVIDVEHVRAAWAVWRYCRASAAYIFGESLGDPIADRLLQAVREAGRDGLDGRQRSKVLNGHASREQLDAACSLLARKGLATIQTVETGGRPITVLRAAEAPLFANSLSSHVSSGPQDRPSGPPYCEQSEQRGLQGKTNKDTWGAGGPAHCEQSEQSEQSPSADECEQSEQSLDSGPPTDDGPSFDESPSDLDGDQFDGWDDEVPPPTDEDFERWAAMTEEGR
jgi:Protein of unknown function (DUF3987)